MSSSVSILHIVHQRGPPQFVGKPYASGALEDVNWIWYRASRASVPAGRLLCGQRAYRESGHRPYGIQYTLRCDESWRTRFLSIKGIGGSTLVIHGDGEGHRRDDQRNEIPEIEGCLDVDAVVTPFTNSLPTRRLTWHQGMERRVSVAWLSISDLQLARADQSYTCIEPGVRFRYESADSGFSANLNADSEGLIARCGGVPCCRQFGTPRPTSDNYRGPAMVPGP
jgi:hypothetical protein